MPTDESNQSLSTQKEMCLVDELTRKISKAIGPILATELEVQVQKNQEISKQLTKLQQEYAMLQEKYQALLEQVRGLELPHEEDQSKGLTLQSNATKARDLLHENESIFDNLVSIIDDRPIVMSDVEFEGIKSLVLKQPQDAIIAKDSSSSAVTNLRKRSDRKNAHAKDCPCCSKFYQIAGFDDPQKRARHLSKVSRHRYKDDISDTPTGFWEVNFTPNQ